MQCKITDLAKSNKGLVISMIIILGVGIFLRSYHFSDWLHFELDQARDARVISWSADAGASTLPLLGPRAGGTFLRLGPAFYYLSYLSAEIFGNTPPGMAGLSLALSILTIPLFYVYMRQYFSWKISAGLLAIFSTSLYFVVYSRFNWNPNLLPFFGILTLYSLLRASSESENRRGIWLAVAAFSLAIATQLHFLAFITFPAIAFLFLIWKRPKLSRWSWTASLSIILLIYSPVIINDFKTGGENIQEFGKAITKKSDKNDHNLAEKISRVIKEESLAYFLLTSSQDRAELPDVEFSSNIRQAIDVQCKYACRQQLPWGIASLILFFSGVWLLFRKIYQDSDAGRRSFLVLNVILFIITMGVFTLLAFDISHRFFLLVAPLPFIFLGLIFDSVKKKVGTIPFVALVFLFVASSLLATRERFSELSRASSESFDIGPDKILNERARVTYEQQMMIADYIFQFHEKNGFPVYISSEPYYQRALIYNLERMNVPAVDFSAKEKKLFQNSNYFLIYLTASNFETDIDKFRERFEIGNAKQFGTLTVFSVRPIEKFLTDVQQEFSASDRPVSGSNVPRRFSWDELLESEEEDEE